MPTIKGPIVIGPDCDMDKVVKQFKEAGAESPLPFKATGFKSELSPVKVEEDVLKEDKKVAKKKRTKSKRKSKHL